MKTRLIWIDEFCVDPQGDVIDHAGEQTRVTPRNMDVLMCLVARRGDVVATRDLLNDVWHGKQDSYNAVYKSIAELRRVFGDTPQTPRYIQTVAKRGYRLVANVADGDDDSLESEMGDTRTGTIRVMQFSNIGGDPRNDPLVHGLAETLIGQLTAVSGLHVASSPVGTREAHAAEHLVEGSVQRDGDRLRITVRLTRAGDRIHLLSRRFDVTAGDVFSLQDEVAGQIVSAVSDALDL